MVKKLLTHKTLYFVTFQQPVVKTATTDEYFIDRFVDSSLINTFKYEFIFRKHMLDRPTLHISRIVFFLLSYLRGFSYIFVSVLNKPFFFVLFFFYLQTINDKDDDPSAANPMLYGPLHGARISKTNQYVATVIRK